MSDTLTITQLNSRFALAGQLTFVEGRGGFPCIDIRNARAQALICVYSAQVLSYRPAGEAEDLLFVSDAAYYQAGKAIKGGVPVCWPWFGPDPEGKGRPAHGFVRNRFWSVLATASLPNGDTQVSLRLVDSEETRALWPPAFALTLVVTVGDTLSLELITRNTGAQPFVITQALHTYFKVGDIGKVKVTGLDNTRYLDKVHGGAEKLQQGAVTIGAEVDRIYTDVHAALVIEDAALGRRIHIGSEGSRTAVVWNPWAKICQEMADLRDEDYRGFVCVETANAAADVARVAAGEEYRLVARYHSERTAHQK